MILLPRKGAQSVVMPGVPISINHMYGSHGKIRFLFKVGKEYKAGMALRAKANNLKLLESNNIWMIIHYYFPDLRRRDVSNYDKGPLDSLSGIVYKDDCQIQSLMMQKFIDRDNPRTEIFIWEEKDDKKDSNKKG